MRLFSESFPYLALWAATALCVFVSVVENNIPLAIIAGAMIIKMKEHW